jgi:ubiquitin-like 1-activating enzyme E1 B
MEKLWETRKKPVPLRYEDVMDDKVAEAGSSSSHVNGTAVNGVALKDQRLWSLRECYEMFAESVNDLKGRLVKEPFLVWDKDDLPALNFVTAVSNLRSYCFSIERKSKFDVKSMAGNIIPAISSTNSVVGGVIGLQLISILRKMPLDRAELGAMDKEEQAKLFTDACRQVGLRTVSLTTKTLIGGSELNPPNPNCIICSGTTQEVDVSLPLAETTMIDFVEQVVIKKLGFVCPSVQVDGTATILWDKDDADDESEEERAVSRQRLITSYPHVSDKCRLKIDDMLQNLAIIITLRDEKVDKNENEGLFYKLKITREGTAAKEENKDKAEEVPKLDVVVTNIDQEMDNPDDDAPPKIEKQVSCDIEYVKEVVSRGQTPVVDLGDDNEDASSDVVCVSDDNDEYVGEESNDCLCLDDSDEATNGNEQSRATTKRKDPEEIDLEEVSSKKART